MQYWWNISKWLRNSEGVSGDKVYILSMLSGDPGFQVRGGALKKIAPSRGRRENFWGISCEKSRFYAKKNHIFTQRTFTWRNYNHIGTFQQRNYNHLGTFTQRNYDHLGIFTQRNYDHLGIFTQRNRSCDGWWLRCVNVLN
jgi:hypothetical protein